VRLCDWPKSSLDVLHIRFKIVEAGDQEGRKSTSSKDLFPCVGSTIRAHLADAFVAVAGAGKSGTLNF
jgi:hypothetical protein